MKEVWNKELRDMQAEECMAYFREYPVFQKLLSGFREKYASYGAFSGTVTLRNLTGEEIEILEGFFQKNFHGQKSVTISAAKFQKALAESRFSVFSPKEVLELYFQERITGKKEQRQREEQERLQLLDRIQKEYENTPAIEWLGSITDWKQGSGAYLLKRYRESGNDMEELQRLLVLGVEIINHFPCCREATEYLAVFAAEITGNPHAFDNGTRDGHFLYILVQWFLRHKNLFIEKSAVFPALQRQRQYLTVGILKDDISNYVMLSGVRARKKNGEMHDGMEGFFREGDMVQVSLSVLAGWEQVECPEHEIYIVENPSVYAILAKNWKGTRACMCMNGQPRLSSILLLDLLAETETEVHYAGDFDPEGLLIAQKVHQYYRGKFSYWHMSAEDYEKSKSKEIISARRLKMLEKITDDELAETVRALGGQKLAGYQENICRRFLRDV